MIRNRHSKDGKILTVRKGRCGRLIQSTIRSHSEFVSPVLDRDSFVLKERIFFPEAINHLRSIQARDCAHLNNAFVGNYNQHYIQCTSNLAAPTSLPSWISATAGLLQNSTTKGGTGGNKTATSGNNNSSPTKKKRPNEEGEGVSNNNIKKAKNTTTANNNSTESTISSLTASPQFTVKVKSKIDSLTSSSSSSGVDELDDLDASVSVSGEQVKKANAARFTPTGLQKESRLD